MAEQLNTLLECLEKVKALDITVIDIKSEADFADYFIICTASSNRHAKTISNECLTSAKENRSFHHSEVDDDMSWVIVDCYDIIIHIMQEESREFYGLENLWNHNSVEKVDRTVND